VLINSRCQEDTKNGDKPRNRPHGRHLGSPKEKPLPFPGKTQPIRFNAINPHWLQSHPENHSARLIYGYTPHTKEETEDLEGNLGYGDGEEDYDAGVEGDGDEDFLDPSLRSDGLANAGTEKWDKEYDKDEDSKNGLEYE
jgi:hypothetical protein